MTESGFLLEGLLRGRRGLLEAILLGVLSLVLLTSCRTSSVDVVLPFIAFPGGEGLMLGGTHFEFHYFMILCLKDN